jgi:uncharacterized protein YutE (UPF0331/DUF86 family)
MVNRSKVNVILEDIEKYLKELESLLPVTPEDLRNIERKYSLAFLLEQIVNECINLGNHIISEKDLGTPASFKEVFDLLAKEDLISSRTAERMKRLVEIRNIIAHRYGKFSNNELLDALKNRKSIKEFVEELIPKITT